MNGVKAVSVHVNFSWIDPRGLGRWSWVRIRGEKQSVHSFRVRLLTTVYHNSSGTGSVWSQHVRYYRSEGIQDSHPRNLFMEEITAAIQAWMADGDHLVFGLDANEDIRTGAVQKKLANIGIFEAIIRHHPTKSVPATCNKNESRKTIDGIWTSPGVEVLRCGYLPFDS